MQLPSFPTIKRVSWVFRTPLIKVLEWPLTCTYQQANFMERFHSIIRLHADICNDAKELQLAKILTQVDFPI